MIFLDSTFILALMFDDQRQHERAKEIYQIIAHETKIINNTILMEILNSIKPHHQMDSTEILNILLNVGEVHFLTEEEYVVAEKMFKYYNYALNYQDCMILKTMQNFQTNRIATFDSGFKKINGLDIVE